MEVLTAGSNGFMMADCPCRTTSHHFKQNQAGSSTVALGALDWTEAMPPTSKFTVPVTEILSHLRDAFIASVAPIPGSLNFQRVVDVCNIIGFDRNRLPTTCITVITDSGGRIITAFPGNLKI